MKERNLGVAQQLTTSDKSPALFTEIPLWIADEHKNQIGTFNGTTKTYDSLEVNNHLLENEYLCLVCFKNAFEVF